MEIFEIAIKYEVFAAEDKITTIATAFILYAVFYFALGVVAMLISMFIRKRPKR